MVVVNPRVELLEIVFLLRRVKKSSCHLQYPQKRWVKFALYAKVNDVFAWIANGWFIFAVYHRILPDGCCRCVGSAFVNSLIIIPNLSVYYVNYYWETFSNERGISENTTKIFGAG